MSSRNKVALLASAAVAMLQGCDATTASTDSAKRLPGQNLAARKVVTQVVDSTGRPVASAQVWLVQSSGDAAPASVIDSIFTDASGNATFDVDSTLDRALLGTDAQGAAGIAIAPLGFAGQDSVRLPLKTPAIAQVQPGPDGALPTLYVPGSHFSSTPFADGVVAQLAVPPGDWKVAVKTSTSTIVYDTKIKYFASMPSYPSKDGTVYPVIDIAFSPEQLWYDSVMLANAAIRNAATDSQVFLGQPYYADNSFPSVMNWSMLVGTIGSTEMLTSLVNTTGTSMLLSTRPKNPGEGSIGSASQAGAGISSPVLTGIGMHSVEFGNVSSDPGLLRTMTLSDAAGAGVRITLGPSLPGGVSFESLDQGGLSLKDLPSGFDPAQAKVWRFGYTKSTFYISADDVFVAKGSTGNLSFQGGIRLSVQVSSATPGVRGSVEILRSQRYVP